MGGVEWGVSRPGWLSGSQIPPLPPSPPTPSSSGLSSSAGKSVCLTINVKGWEDTGRRAALSVIYNLVLRPARLLLWALTGSRGRDSVAAWRKGESIVHCANDQAAAHSLGLGGAPGAGLSLLPQRREQIQGREG